MQAIDKTGIAYQIPEDLLRIHWWIFTIKVA